MRISKYLPLVLIFSYSSLSFADFHITSVMPPPQYLTAGLAPEIKIEFDSPADPATINAQSILISGRWTGVMPGEFRLENENRLVRFLPARTFSAGEWITVAVSKRVKNAAGEALANGYTWNFWTLVMPSNASFRLQRRISVRLPNEVKVRTYGVYAGDLNGDGHHDLTVPNEDAHDVRVFMNDGSGRYSYSSRYPLPTPARPSTNEGMDFNGDNIIDFAVGNILGNSVSVLLGNGRGGFLSPVTYPVGREPRGLSVMDLDGDGDMDIVTANRVGNSVSILHNKGDGSFDASQPFEAGGENETACATADANEDGILDLFVGAFNSREMILLLGDGKGGLVFSSKVSAGGSPWMVAVGDVDNDGHVDVVSCNAREDLAAVIRGDGKGNLLPAETYQIGDFPLAIDAGDLDGDCDLDIITSNYGSSNWTLLQNSGKGKFSYWQSLQAVEAGSCAVLHDRDRDGDLDITGVDEEADFIFLVENGTPSAVAEETSTSPSDFALGQSYPNPFLLTSSSPSFASQDITIPFSLRQPAKVNLRVVNLTGQTVAVLVDGIMSPGMHSVNFASPQFAPGIYFCIMTIGAHTLVRKIAIL